MVFSSDFLRVSNIGIIFAKNHIEKVKVSQKNWIGRSEGAEVDFKLANFDETLKVYTTRPDTLFGATYMVISPE